MPSNLVTSISGVGPQAAERLSQLGIRTVTDLLLHMPRDYQDRTRRTLLRDVADEDCVVQGTIVEVAEQFKNQRGIHVFFEDETGRGAIRLLNYGSSQRKSFRVGSWLYVYGKPAYGKTFIILNIAYSMRTQVSRRLNFVPFTPPQRASVALDSGRGSYGHSVKPLSSRNSRTTN